MMWNGISDADPIDQVQRLWQNKIVSKIKNKLLFMTLHTEDNKNSNNWELEKQDKCFNSIDKFILILNTIKRM